MTAIARPLRWGPRRQNPGGLLNDEQANPGGEEQGAQPKIRGEDIAHGNQGETGEDVVSWEGMILVVMPPTALATALGTIGGAYNLKTHNNSHARPRLSLA
jgi:hypothetical protein